MTDTLSAGTYEILKGRLREAAADLRDRFDRLNKARGDVFGNIETRLLSTAHVTTDHNCVPRDILAIGDRLLLGYNVQFGLQTEILPQDVFAIYRLSDDIAQHLELEELTDQRWQRDFAELYRYYKNTSFARFHIQGPHVYFVFQVGKSATDIKSFKWVADTKSLSYVDNRSEQEVRFPAQHAFQWRRATRDQHRSGAHPHISIDDIVFVECIGGDLTIKVEDNTQDGSGIYSEPVDHADQTLDDAEIHYCVLDNLVLLRIRPYQERDFRHLVFSRKRSTVLRLDEISRSCILLPQDHGIIFPGGMVLQTGEHKLLDHGLNNLMFDRTIAAPNGEDFLFVFIDPLSGTYLLLRYNMIRQSVDVPLVCNGYSLMVDGQMITFRGSDSPQKHHALQIWQTPFVSPNIKQSQAVDSLLYKIGNRELVTCMAECQELLKLVDKDDNYQGLYVDLAKRASIILDSYHWLDRAETCQLNEPLLKLRETATAAIEEFERVIRVRRDTEKSLQTVSAATSELLRSIQRSSLDSIGQFVEKLASIRTQRGHAIGLRELRYIDLPQVDILEQQLIEAGQQLAQRCLQFLLQPQSLLPYQQRIEALAEVTATIKTAIDGKKLQEELSQVGSEMELLIDTVSHLKIDDLTQRTQIVDRTGNILAELNRVRSTVSARVRDLLSGEMEADFASQIKLLDQAAAGALEAADSPEKVDESLTRLLLQLEEIEGRFAEFNQLLVRLTEKRESIFEAFEARRTQLVEARARRAESLVSAADRILQGISTRSQRLEDTDKLLGFFASDSMVDKVRQIANQLQQLGDSVRMDDILSRLKAIQDDSLRQLRDRRELFSANADLIQLGKHQFSVNQQPIELTTVVRGGSIQLHLTGTQFFQALNDPDLDLARDLWEQHLPSESPSIYRAEFLAAIFCQQFLSDPLQLSKKQFLASSPEQQVELMRGFMEPRHDEGYARGVHDRDAALIAAQVLKLEMGLGLLRFAPDISGLANFAWKFLIPHKEAQAVQTWISGLSSIASVLPKVQASQAYVQRLFELLREHAFNLFAIEITGNTDQSNSRHNFQIHQAAQYLFELLRWQSEHDPVVATNRPEPPRLISPQAASLLSKLRQHLPQVDQHKIEQALQETLDRPLAAWTLALDTARGYLRELSPDSHYHLSNDGEPAYLFELASLLLDSSSHTITGPDQPIHVQVAGLSGDHPQISQGKLNLHIHQFRQRVHTYIEHDLPRFKSLRSKKLHLLHQAGQKLRCSEFKAKVLTSFVRNQLINEVYLPLIGDNLAKQIGSAGDSKRSDRMGMLLLISPPGYGKTTLMEYIANRLGLVFVKVNGPALGHRITSLDPAEATNASAREEVKRINLALEMGDNVMLYLDDIQHCHPELLQKFIPLCDATRRIEGVWETQPKTYDLRGRKFAVVMAGNPYTESGDHFRIPDMLANRADVYNLGEIIGDARDAFELSYIENCLTSNPVLQPLSRLSSQDQRAVIQAAQRGTKEGLNLQANLPLDQLSEMINVLSKLLKVRDVLLRVNRAYIRSAAQVDAYRTEPPFKLQGSYRNMNRLAERIEPVMNDAELNTLIMANYEQDAQTLTRDGEANLLKFKELLGNQTKEESERWENIKYAYLESVRLQGIEGEDSTAQVLKMLSGLRDGLESIRRALVQAIAAQQPDLHVQAVDQAVGKMVGGLTQLAEQITQAIGRGAGQIQQASSQLPDQKVLVQHSVPRVMTDLVQTQFQLLYDGLRPVLESVSRSSGSMESLRNSMEACLQQYNALKQEIEKSQG